MMRLMTRWSLLIVTTAIAVAGYLGVHFRAQRERAEQEANFRAVVDSYAREFRPGTTRADVEDRLKKRGIFSVGQTTTGKQGDGLADIIRIGEVDDVPWYCSRHGVYVELLFSTATDKPWDPAPEDKLTRVMRTGILEGCL